MGKILIIILTIITFVICKNILSLETIEFPWYRGGKIIFFGYWAKSFEILFVIIIVTIFRYIIRYIVYRFGGGKIQNKTIKYRAGLRNGIENVLEYEEYEDCEEDVEEFMDEESLFLKYPEIKENILEQKEEEIIRKIKKIDNKFNEILFLAKAYEFSKELIKTKIIKYTSAEHIYETFNNGIRKVSIPSFYSIEKFDEHYGIKLRVKEYKNNLLKCTYEMIFLKIIKKEVVSLKCPRCGAPLPKKLGGICRYCFKYNDKEGNKKIKSNVSKFSYDIPIIKFGSTNLTPKVCINCGAPLKKEYKGICEYCKSDNKSLVSEWVMMDFYKIK